jgi:hypothetical protein
MLSAPARLGGERGCSSTACPRLVCDCRQLPSVIYWCVALLWGHALTRLRETVCVGTCKRLLQPLRCVHNTLVPLQWPTCLRLADA